MITISEEFTLKGIKLLLSKAERLGISIVEPDENVRLSVEGTGDRQIVLEVL